MTIGQLFYPLYFDIDKFCENQSTIISTRNYSETQVLGYLQNLSISKCNEKNSSLMVMTWRKTSFFRINQMISFSPYNRIAKSSLLAWTMAYLLQAPETCVYESTVFQRQEVIIDIRVRFRTTSISFRFLSIVIKRELFEKVTGQTAQIFA